MKKEARKLNLTRETLAPMQQQELAEVNGGFTPTITTSSTACVSAASAVGSAIVHTVSMAFESRWCGGKK